jgi:hypothetical protein
MNAVLERAPEASVLSTKGTGTMAVNDPLLKMINGEIVAGRDINWPRLWARAQERLGDNPNFKDYIAPHKNLGVLFLKAYKSRTGQARG